MLIGATDGRGEASGGNNAATNGVVGIKKDPSGAWTAAYEWQATKATSSFGSPLAHRGVAYFVNRTGVVQALDLKSGEPLYTQRGPGSVWATPVGIDGSVLLFCKDGQIAALEAGPEFVVLGEPTEPPAAPAAPAPEPAPAETTPPVETPSGRPGRGGAPAAGRTLYGVAVGPDCVLVREGDRLHRLPLVHFVAP